MPCACSCAMPELPRAHGEAVLAARMRVQPVDFRVRELDAFAASGAGEHLLLTVEKCGLATAQAARRIAQWAGVAESAIGYAGLKDRHALTVQRFSVWLPKRTAPDIDALHADDLRVLDHAWHARKLPRGALAGNRFELCLRDVAGDAAAIEARLQAIGRRGVPNAFGEQRFGRHGDNVAQALAMFDGRRVRREERSLLLSAARSALFNQVLGARVAADNWDAAIEGDVFMLEGSHSVFGPEPIDEALRARVAGGDIHPTGPLWGRGTLRTDGQARAIEEQAMADAQSLRLREGLERAGMKQERRSLRLPVCGLAWQWLDDETALELRFVLPAGSYATSVLAELGRIEDTQRG